MSSPAPFDHPSADRRDVDRPGTARPRFGGERHAGRLASGLLVAPSILSADFARLGDECAAALAAGGDLLHVDVMDGHFVPNLSMGPAICASLHKALPDACLDVHLMVTDPAAYIEPFARAGAAHITFHIEVAPDPRAMIDAIHARGLSAGLAINPDTPADAILPFLGEVELALVMSVYPGFSGQKFIDRVLAKTRILRDAAPVGVRVQMDGGVAPDSAPACRAHGCDLIVAASAIFGRSDYAAAIRALR
jgi:ribulose-phosphate 3-epimerase